jgi:hypothetical protein
MKENVILMISLLVLALSAASIGMPDETTKTSTVGSSSGEKINWQVISSGGLINGSSANFRLGGTVGQTAVGTGISTDYGLSHGFWQNFEAGQCDCMPGDANGNTIINILDITYLISYVYKSGPAPTPYALCSGDPTGNCIINILDITYLISYIYKGGPLPVTCEQWLGDCGPPLRK